MLRTEQRHEFDTSVDQPRNVVRTMLIDACLIRDQSNAGVSDQVDRIGHQNIDSGTDPLCRCRAPEGTTNNTKSERQLRHRASMIVLTVLAVMNANIASGQSHATDGSVDIDSIMQSLTVEQKVGQLIMPWLLGSYTADDSETFTDALAWIDELAIGGIVISTGTPLAAAAKLNTMQRRSRLPLIVAADFEYGVAMRMAGATGFPQAMGIGATGNEDDAYQVGKITAIEARAIGVHWTFSPVADLNNNPDNPIINTRSFGETPEEAGPLIAAYIRGANEYGLYTTAKHFPGHGDTGTDSHIALPVSSACWERLDTLELAPFRAAIAAGVTSVMTAHIALPCLGGGTNVPATLSPTLTRSLLGDSLGFHGVVVTDALAMGAIVTAYGVGESAVMAFLAGSDVLLYPSDPAVAHAAVVAAVRAGRISIDRLDQSVRKLLELKQRAGLFQERTVSLERITQSVGAREHVAVADDIATRSLTLVQEGQLSVFRNARARVAVITYAEETNLQIGNTLIRNLRELGDTVNTFRLYPASGPMSYDSARVMIRSYPRVVYATSVRAISSRGHVALPQPLAEMIERSARSKASMLISFGSPYLLHQLPDYHGGFLIAWTDVEATEKAAAFALSGGAPISGRLPISISGAITRGFGISIPRRAP